MTKSFAILFLAILCVSLAGCGENVNQKANRERQETAIRDMDNAVFGAEQRLRAIEQKPRKDN